MKKLFKIIINKILLIPRYRIIQFFRRRKIGLKKENTIYIGKNVKNYGCTINVGKNVWIMDNTSFKGGGMISIGNESHIGPNSVLYASKEGGISIGNDVNFARNLFIIDCNHGYHDKKVLIRKQPMDIEKIIIGSNVWVGVNSTIIKGAKINDGTVVGACSLVNKYFPPNSVIGGVPAKLLKNR